MAAVAAVLRIIGRWGVSSSQGSALALRRFTTVPPTIAKSIAAGDAGLAPLTNAYLDAQLADTILVVGANPYETQTNTS